MANAPAKILKTAAILGAGTVAALMLPKLIRSAGRSRTLNHLY